MTIESNYQLIVAKLIVDWSYEKTDQLYNEYQEWDSKRKLVDKSQHDRVASEFMVFALAYFLQLENLANRDKGQLDVGVTNNSLVASIGTLLQRKLHDQKNADKSKPFLDAWRNSFQSYENLKLENMIGGGSIGTMAEQLGRNLRQYGFQSFDVEFATNDYLTSIILINPNRYASYFVAFSGV